MAGTVFYYLTVEYTLFWYLLFLNINGYTNNYKGINMGILFRALLGTLLSVEV